VKLFPNPVNDLLYIGGEDLAGARIQILNLLGSVLMEEHLMGGNGSLNMTGLNEGIYFIRIMKNDRQFLGRVAVQR